MFITFEGTEGSGKTSQAQVLAGALEQSLPVLLTREPGGTLLGDRVRQVLLSTDGVPLDPLSELLLFSAARAQLVREVLTPALDRGDVVICVRYADSTRAYQGGGGRLPEATVETAIELATGGLEPDLTLYLDLDPEEGLRRRLMARDHGAAEGWNSMDARDLEYHRQVRRSYQEVARKFPRRIVTIDASRSFEEVSANVLAVVRDRIGPTCLE